MVICQLSSDTCAVRLIDSLGRKLMLTFQDTRDGRKGEGHRLNHPSRREKSKWNYQSDKPNPNHKPLLPLSVDNGVNDGDDDADDERGRVRGREREEEHGKCLENSISICNLKNEICVGIKINDNFPLYTHCTSRVQSAWPTVHPLCTHRATLQVGRDFCLCDSVMTVLWSVIKYFKVAKRPKKNG